jgi:hypothetical protein
MVEHVPHSYQHVTYGRLRDVLTSLGFREERRPDGLGLEHKKSKTLFLFRAYQEGDFIKPAEVLFVRKLLDERGLLEGDAFEALLSKTPA